MMMKLINDAMNAVLIQYVIALFCVCPYAITLTCVDNNDLYAILEYSAGNKFEYLTKMRK